MVNLISRLRNKLKNQNKKIKIVPIILRNCIQNSIYGVDIDISAVVAKLRLWLSLIVDETDYNSQNLPNLDYK